MFRQRNIWTWYLLFKGLLETACFETGIFVLYLNVYNNISISNFNGVQTFETSTVCTCIVCLCLKENFNLPVSEHRPPRQPLSRNGHSKTSCTPNQRKLPQKCSRLPPAAPPDPPLWTYGPSFYQGNTGHHSRVNLNWRELDKYKHTETPPHKCTFKIEKQQRRFFQTCVSQL